MKKVIFLCLPALLLSSASGALLAQDYDYHPYLSDSFLVSAGVMLSTNNFKMKSDLGSDIGDEIDFDDTLNVDDHNTLFNGQLKWQFGKEQKWNVAVQYFSSDAEGDAELTEDIEWDGLTFKAGSFVRSGVKLEVARLFFGRSFIKNNQHDFGIGVGLHTLKAKAFIEGEAITNEGSSGYQRADEDVSQPLPNIGGWYNFSPAKKWLLHARVDWIGAEIGDYDGHMWNTNIGVNYQAFRHIGFDLSWQYFNLNVSVDSDDWTGGVDMSYRGPVLAITGNW